MFKLSKTKICILNIMDAIGKIIFFPCLGKKKRATKKFYGLNIKKVLVMEVWGIGDLVMASSSLRALKKALPHAQVNLLSKEVAGELFKYNAGVDRFFFFDFPWTKFRNKYKLWIWDFHKLLKLLSELRQEKFDLVLDARGDFRNNFFSFLIGAQRRVGYDWTKGGFFLTDVVDFDYRDKHRIDAWVQLLDYCGIKVENPQPCIEVSKQEKDWAARFLNAHGIEKNDILMGIYPGARIKTRCWPLDRFARVAERVKEQYHAKIIVFIEPQGYGQDIPLEGDFIPVKATLREMIALIQQCHLLICNDGGAMHMATAVNTPTVAIFGPTVPRWFGPYGDKHLVIIKDNYPCRPCFDYCRYKEPYCLKEISAEDVILKLDNKLNELGFNKIIT